MTKKYSLQNVRRIQYFLQSKDDYENNLVKVITEVAGVLGLYIFLCGWTYTDYFLKTFAIDFAIFGFPIHYFFVEGFKALFNFYIIILFIILLSLFIVHNYSRFFLKIYKKYPIGYLVCFFIALVIVAWGIQNRASNLGYTKAKNIQNNPCCLPYVSYKEKDKSMYAFLLMQSTNKLYLLNPQLLTGGVERCNWDDESVIILSTSEISNLKLSGYIVNCDQKGGI